MIEDNKVNRFFLPPEIVIHKTKTDTGELLEIEKINTKTKKHEVIYNKKKNGDYEKFKAIKKELK